MAIQINASKRAANIQNGLASLGTPASPVVGSYDSVSSVGSANSWFGDVPDNHYEQKMEGKEKDKARDRS